MSGKIAVSRAQISSQRLTWALLTPEYPPSIGGIGDYTHELTLALAAAGDSVVVWAPEITSRPLAASAELRALPDRFGVKSRRQLEAELQCLAPNRILLVQYAPHGFGCRAMNLTFCRWLTRRSERLWLMFHEVAYPFERGQTLRRDILAGVQRLMARWLAQGADRTFVSIPAWARLLRAWATPRSLIEWLPVSSNLPERVAPDARARMRGELGLGSDTHVLGFFGNYGSILQPALEALLTELLTRDARRVALLAGGAGRAFASEFGRRHAALAPRLIAPGQASARSLAEQLTAADLMIYPFVDGVSTRRTSLMAALALGLPIVTSEGPLSEPLWRESGAVALARAGDHSAMVATAERALASPAELQTLGRRGQELYRSRFQREVLVARLRAIAQRGPACGLHIDPGAHPS